MLWVDTVTEKYYLIIQSEKKAKWISIYGGMIRVAQ